VGVEASPLCPVTTGPVVGDFKAWWNFILGRFHRDRCHKPNQTAPAFRIAAIVSEL
jgi:hypothetical protein